MRVKLTGLVSCSVRIIFREDVTHGHVVPKVGRHENSAAHGQSVK